MLSGMDMRRCTLRGIAVSEGFRELRGMIVDMTQAAELSALLGVVVRP